MQLVLNYAHHADTVVLPALQLTFTVLLAMERLASEVSTPPIVPATACQGIMTMVLPCVRSVTQPA